MVQAGDTVLSQSWVNAQETVSHHTAAHLNASLMLTLLWGHLLSKKGWGSKSNHQ